VVGAEDYGDWNGYIISFRFFISVLTIIHLALRDPSMDLEPVDFQKTHPDLIMMARAIEGLRRPLLHHAYFSHLPALIPTNARLVSPSHRGRGYGYPEGPGSCPSTQRDDYIEPV